MRLISIRRTAVALVPIVVLLTGSVSRQGRAQIGTPQRNPPRPAPGASYGPPDPYPLDEIAYGGGSFQKRNVLTRGNLDPLVTTRYFVLSEPGARVLLLPMEGMEEALRRLIGRRVELTGVVRALPSNQQYHPACGIDSKCDDPELPELPNARSDWPPVSITVLTATDISPLEPRRRGGPSTSIEDLRADPKALLGKDVTVVGIFRGRNLYGDLSGTVADPSAWVLKDGSSAVWVFGRKPEGKGFKLDPQYKGDTSRWLEVTGRVLVVNDVVCLKASKVALTSAPAVETAPD